MKSRHILNLFVGIFCLGAASPEVSQKAHNVDEASVSVASFSTAGMSMSTSGRRAAVCEALAGYPKPANTKMAFETGQIAPICQPFVSRTRASLDMCGDKNKDPYASGTTVDAHDGHVHSHVTRSNFTWPTRTEMYKRGQINVITDPKGEPLRQGLVAHAEKVRQETTALCCNGDERCEDAMKKVQVQVCKPSVGENDPDSCVYGGVYQVPAEEFGQASTRLKKEEAGGTFSPATGNITLSSYVSADHGSESVDSVIRHEFGHACSMVKMQLSAASPFWQKLVDQDQRAKADRARQWVDDVRNRCDAKAKLPEAYNDFFESIGETREFSACIYKLAEMNQKQQVDRTCDKLCPGHYMEEAVGITFSLLTGDLSGKVGAVFPNTCNHVRDAQHPMVSDVMDCLTQHSPRFRAKLRDQYSCGTGTLASN